MTIYRYEVLDAKNGEPIAKLNKDQPLAHLTPGVSLLIKLASGTLDCEVQNVALVLDADDRFEQVQTISIHVAKGTHSPK